MDRKRSNIYGWATEDEVAEEIYCSQFRNILEGNLVFAYKDQGNSGTIDLFVVTKTPRGFRLGFFSKAGWSSYIPCCPQDYLETTVLEDLKKNKTEKYIIDDYIDCIKYYGKN